MYRMYVCMYVCSDISTIEWLSIKLKGSATVQIEYETTSVLCKQWACAVAKTASLTFDFSLWATVNTPVHEPTRSQGEDKANTAPFFPSKIGWDQDALHSRHVLFMHYFFPSVARIG